MQSHVQRLNAHLISRDHVCMYGYTSIYVYILTTNLAAGVCVSVCAKFDQFQPARSHFDYKRPKIFVRIATFPSATFGPLFSFHYLYFLLKTII